MFLHLITAILFVMFIASIAYLAVKFNDRHTHLEYDDRIENNRREKALARYLKEVKKTNDVEN